MRRSITQAQETFCNGLFLSARWFVVSAAAHEGINLIVLPNREAAEYCAADLYHLTEGDCVFYLPDSGKSLEKSNFKASLGVQRTSALGKILKESSEKLFLVTYPEALSEPVPAAGTIQKTLSNNPYMKLPVDKWAENGAPKRVLLLMDKINEEIIKREIADEEFLK